MVHSSEGRAASLPGWGGYPEISPRRLTEKEVTAPGNLAGRESLVKPGDRGTSQRMPLLIQARRVSTAEQMLHPLEELGDARARLALAAAAQLLEQLALASG